MADSGTTSQRADEHHDHPDGHQDDGEGIRQGSGWAAAWESLLPTAAAPPRGRGRLLQSALRDAVRSGRIAAGTRLPSSRELAADLGVSRGLVTDAYEQLTAEGYLRSARGAGTWVSGAVRAVPSGGRTPEGAGAPDGPVTGFLPGSPDLSLFPRATWAAAHRRALTRLPHSGLGYPDPRGLPELRDALAGLLSRRRGVVADPERVIVCSGVAQAMTLLGLALADGSRDRTGHGTVAGHGHGHGHGHEGMAGHWHEGGTAGDGYEDVAGRRRPVALEDPGSPEHAALFAAAGLSTVPVPLDADGLAPDALSASGAGAAVLTPSHQFPSGIAYSARRRAALLAWARRTDALLIEDDYDGDFRYDRQPVGALQGLDPARVAYTGSVSKSLAPGLRLGWLVAPDALMDRIVERKRTLDLGHPVLDQALLADLITRGDYDRQLRRCRRAYRERRDVLVAALTERFPGTEVTGIAAGLHVIARLPARYGPQDRFLARARRTGVALRALGDHRFAAGPESEDGDVRLVLGYAHLTPARIVEAVRLLPS
ncbi:PLP-dependent aminotransferase family protein [Streptomyces sp. P1-3]|uniref:aminotransferase-like domain-containing protein n=1 Tax=Streptomyces sp. P1-3 TaxID=3421658 RepID=UPI003D36B575